MTHFCDDERELCEECAARDGLLEEEWHRRMEIEGKGPYYIPDENGD